MIEPQRSDHRLLAFVELVKPELTGLVVFTGVLAYLLASHEPDRIQAAALLGVASFLVGAGAASLNQFMERGFDMLMKRTERRPIPSGRIKPGEAIVVGSLASLVGLGMLFLLFGPLPAILGLVTLATYLGMYTPLKRRSPWNTFVGAFPGALPTLIGWSAAEGRISTGGWLLFAILFLWQFPHFFSLAWMYRKDYARAGYKMLPVIDDEAGSKTNMVNILSIIGLLAVTSMMALLQISGLFFFVSSLVLGVGFLWVATNVRSTQRTQDLKHRIGRPQHLFFASLAYLPTVLVVGLLDRVS